MADLAFAPQHNMIAYLEKTKSNAEFHQIVDFLTSSSIYHSLTIHAIVDGKTVIITKSSVRKDLLFTDVNGITYLTHDNMIRKSEKFSGTVTPLFATMLSPPAVVEGEGSGNPSESQPTTSPAQPINESQIPESSSSPQNTQSPRKTLKGTGFPHTRDPIFLIQGWMLRLSIRRGDSLGEGLGSGLRRQENIRGAMAHIRSEDALIQSIDPPLSTGYTVRSREDRMEHDIELTNPILDMENVKTAQAKEIASLTKRVTKLEQRQSSRFLGFHPFRVGSSKRHSLGMRKDADTKMIIEDKGNGEKGDSTAKTVSTARLDISAAMPETKNQKAKEKGIAFKDADDSARPIRSITTLQPLLTIDLKDKGKDILQESKPVKKSKKMDQDQIERDAEVALKIQADLNEEARTKIERQEEASKAALAKMYDEVQAQIDTDHGLVVKFTLEEQEKYTVEERSKLLVEFFERRKKQLSTESFKEIQKLYIKEHKWVDAFVPMGSEEDKKRFGSRKKRSAGSSTKHKSIKKQKVNDQEYKDSDIEHRKCLKVVPDDDKAINYETLDVKSLIVDCESQVLGTNKAGDVHVYKLTRLDGSYRHFSTFSRMLEVLDRQDVLDLHKIIMEKFLAIDPEGYDLIL
nr:hypothetical protein [Tanacetum cinerariifolium]